MLDVVMTGWKEPVQGSKSLAYRRFSSDGEQDLRRQKARGISEFCCFRQVMGISCKAIVILQAFVFAATASAVYSLVKQTDSLSHLEW